MLCLIALVLAKVLHAVAIDLVYLLETTSEVRDVGTTKWVVDQP